MKDYIIVVIIGYLFGLIQASYLLGMWLYKVDVRKYGKEMQVHQMQPSRSGLNLVLWSLSLIF